MTLPVALSGTDVIGQAKTGTGKTLGFGLPLLDRVTVPADVEAGRAKPEDLTDTPQALVVVPTRELCQQVTNDLLTAGKARNVRVTAIYGGRAYEPQVEALKKGVDVVIGTPGRLLDLAGQKKLNLKHVKCLVLDEADEMLDLGFLPDVEKIINMLPVRRQTMLFSATMPGAVIGLARRYMSQPTHIRATAPDDAGATVANTKQFIYRAHNMDKPEMVARILQADGRGLAMVFCRTKRTAADLADQLKQRGFASGAVHGDLGQGAREQALRAFRNGKVDVLVCTDVAARGIDVEGVTHVINYQSPEEEKTYLHRIGRTGRAGAKGTAITLVDWDDIPRWQLINKALELGFNDPPETYSTSPHLFSDLGIPEGTKGVLPRSERTRAGLDAEELEDLGEPGGRAPRGRGGRNGRGGRDESKPAERERSERTPRRRRRTRGGAALGSAPESTGTTAPDATATGGTAEADAVTAPRTPRRRRRTRGGASAESAPVTAVESASPAPSEQAADAVATAEGTSVEAPEAAKSRRRRTRRSETPVETPVVETEAAVTPSATESAAVVADAPVTAEPEASATKPRRRTRKSTAASAAEAAVDTAEGTTESVTEPVETKPRRTRKTAAVAPEGEAPEAKPRRTRKATAAAEAAVDTAEAAETKPRRTRKTATAAEAAVDTAEATEAKPKRTRKATAPAAGAVDTAEAAETKPRRTRKTAAAAEAAVDTAEDTEAKPRRRTRKAAETATAVETVTAEIPAQTAQEPEVVEKAEAKPRRARKAAPKAEASVDTAEATEAKPRRTRKTAAVAPDAEAAEAKPRRTRKAAAAAETAVDTAEAAEAKPRRRTRKAAEAVEAAGAVTAEIPAQTAQEPDAAKPRRTRKTAAAAATASADGTAEAKPKARRTRKATATAEPTEG
ncbi:MULTISPECIES: DEAD/DEAH box helicase [Streptomyces]|uniref:RNA helicase n=1 Tax=Streptomyces koelreuteriae TaxID=2838015 RepID=A0ABX8G4P0_9ACTN|nr:MULTISPECIES: DEAD/DEAH box helicase [Streptomyces]QWB28209.1 DEAD/DEAH box helicase [Streptomyces koelreuteriae]UUA11295.1 DEAD/DEAH box helicase [Streptomyces koelreuteriae]UUA18896.1 DEAD/DEAH box helicase [Streptomyces sp. CRCS-T-1]